MCGIVGIFSHKPVSYELHDSLVQLQHRGQDAAGIMTCDYDRFYRSIGKGLVRDIFSKDDLTHLMGDMGIGHVRYPTSGKNSAEETQPFWLGSPFGIALAHNGDLVNTAQLKEELKQQTHRHINTDSDTEILLHLIAEAFRKPLSQEKSDQTFFEILTHVMSYVSQHARGSYSIVSLIIGKGLLAYRDPRGIRPLVYGQKTDEHGKIDHIFASEPTMFQSLGFKNQQSLQPGELVFINTDGEVFRTIIEQKSFSPCIFEYVYFARPDGVLDDVSVYQSRRRMGEALAKQWQERFSGFKPDVVIPVPFSSNTSAIALAQALNIPYEEGLYKNPYIGRTFITAGTDNRKKSVQYKLHAQESAIKGKNILVVDDSIVRGTTSKEIVAMLKAAGANEIYFASSAPPVKHPCFYGINMPTSKELIASNQSIDEIKNYLGVDALLYQTQEDLVDSVARKTCMKPCMACFNGDYIEGKPCK
jgi:amidophosphoribosyltransferase